MSESYFQRADDFMRAVANNATFGAADYIAGYGNKAIFGGTAAQNIDEQHDLSKQAADRSPKTTFVGETIGNGLAAEAMSLGLAGKSLLDETMSLYLFSGFLGSAMLTNLGRHTEAKDATEPAADSIEPAPNAEVDDAQAPRPNSLVAPKTTMFTDKLAPQNDLWQKYLPPLDLAD